MEKISRDQANELFNDVRSSFTDYETVKYSVNDHEYQIKVHHTLTVLDRLRFAESVANNAYVNGEENLIHRQAEIARIVIRDLTDLPMPTIPTPDNGEEVDDLPMCYELVYGLDGLLAKSVKLDALVFAIEEAVDVLVENKKRQDEPVRRLYNRALELGAELNAVLADAVQNPATMEKWLRDNLPTELQDTLLTLVK